MDEKNNFGRLLVLLLLTLVSCLSLYYLPETIAGKKIRKVDLLSDIRNKDYDSLLDSLYLQLAAEDTLVIDPVAVCDSVIQAIRLDSATLALRDSLYKVLYAAGGADSLGVHIEDYSLGRTGLKRFFEKLDKREQLGRPVRIAFMGDSFIEGDILVADFRDYMQNTYGGRGVGFVPVHSAAHQFRPTIKQTSGGWTTHSLMKNREYSYTLPGMLFAVKDEEAYLTCSTVDRYANLAQVSSLKFIYGQSEGALLHIACNGSTDTLVTELPPTRKISQYVLQDNYLKQAFLRLTSAVNFHALGVVLEDETGVIVDNFSLRGNSGLLLEHFNPDYCAAWNEVRPYDLIILQYGLNMMSEEMLQYGAYRNRMVEMIRHLRTCFPDSDILLLGISDRSRTLEDGSCETMPAVLAMLHAQRQMAKMAGIPFWNLFGAMGGHNSMVRFVEKNWASKDYTHLSFRGGREIAKSLYNALLLEKQFYEEADNTLP